MHLSQIFAIIAGFGFIGLTVFQILLVLGFPLGKASWGGKHLILPLKLRIASSVSIGLLVFATLVVLEKTKFIAVFKNPSFVSYSIWGLTALFGLSTFGNISSSSKIEKLIMIPTALVLFLSCLVISLFS
jgi:hypothetical protein